jgi:hypothetical protein
MGSPSLLSSVQPGPEFSERDCDRKGPLAPYIDVLVSSARGHASLGRPAVFLACVGPQQRARLPVSCQSPGPHSASSHMRGRQARLRGPAKEIYFISLQRK